MQDAQVSSFDAYFSMLAVESQDLKAKTLPAFPRSSLDPLFKRGLPDGYEMDVDVREALTHATYHFLTYLTCAAHDVRSTSASTRVQPHHIVAALEELGFGDVSQKGPY